MCLCERQSFTLIQSQLYLHRSPFVHLLLWSENNLSEGKEGEKKECHTWHAETSRINGTVDASSIGCLLMDTSLITRWESWMCSSTGIFVSLLTLPFSSDFHHHIHFKYSSTFLFVFSLSPQPCLSYYCMDSTGFMASTLRWYNTCCFDLWHIWPYETRTANYKLPLTSSKAQTHALSLAYWAISYWITGFSFC